MGLVKLPSSAPHTAALMREDKQVLPQLEVLFCTFILIQSGIRKLWVLQMVLCPSPIHSSSSLLFLRAPKHLPYTLGTSYLACLGSPKPVETGDKKGCVCAG